MSGNLVITGLGVVSAIGQGRDAFAAALFEGRHAFGVMQREGRQRDSAFLGAEIPALRLPAEVTPRVIRAASLTSQAALATVAEAWNDARLAAVDPERIGLIVGGSNFQQRALLNEQGAHAGRAEFVSPSYALSFLDTDVCGFCTAQFGIRGPSFTVGGASASGQLAIIQGARAVLSGEVDACIAVGALMDLSYWECQALRSAGAMGTDRYASDPSRACRPFDAHRDGFIFGESCGAVVIEAERPAAGREPYARLLGWGISMDANRGADPSLDGEVRAIDKALRMAGLAAADIDYINPHGSASVLGDQTEVAAIRACGLHRARINATKSITGHGLTAAGAVEVVATLLQMRAGRLHSTRNLETPVDPSLNWIRDRPENHCTRLALTLSIGFGGINTALVLGSCS